MKVGVVLFFYCMAMAGCESESYLKHSIDQSRISDRCDEVPASFKVSANFGRQRFEFAKCLPADFTGKQVMVERNADTIVVSFPRPLHSKALFNITLDIESHPRYQYLSVDGETYTILFPDN